MSGNWIVKANHGSGMNLIGLAGAALETRPIVERCQYWLTFPYGCYMHEWAYPATAHRPAIQVPDVSRQVCVHPGPTQRNVVRRRQ
jgi:hypothetical protein